MAYNHFKYLKADGSQGTPEDYVSKEDLTGEYLFNRKINGVSTQYILKQPDKNGESFNYYIIKSPLLINYYKYAFKTYINGVWGEEVYYATNDIPVLGESIYNTSNELVGKVIEIGHQKITLNTELVLYRYFDEDIKEISFLHHRLSDTFDGDIVISDNRLTFITGSSFQKSSSLTSMDLSGCNNLISIGEYCFAECSNLTSVVLPSSLESIGENCFYACSNLQTITINKSENSITGAPWGATNATVVWNG